MEQRDPDGRSIADTLAPTPSRTPIRGSLSSPPTVDNSVDLPKVVEPLISNNTTEGNLRPTASSLKALLTINANTNNLADVVTPPNRTPLPNATPAVSAIPHTPVTTTPSLAANPKYLNPLPIRAAARLTNPEMERQAKALAARQFRENILISRAPAQNRIDELDGNSKSVTSPSASGGTATSAIDVATKKKGVVSVLINLRQSLASAGLLLFAGYTPSIVQASPSGLITSALAAPSIGTSKLTPSHKAIRLQQTLLSQELPLGILRADSGINLSWVQRIIADDIVYPLYGNQTRRAKTPLRITDGSSLVPASIDADPSSKHIYSSKYPYIDELLQHGRTVPIAFHASGSDIPLEVLERAAKGEPIVLAKDEAGFDDVGAHTEHGKKNLLTFLAWRVRTIDGWAAVTDSPQGNNEEEHFGAIDSPRSALVCYRHGLQISNWNHLESPNKVANMQGSSSALTPRGLRVSESAFGNNAEAIKLARDAAIEAQSNATDSFLPIVEDYRRLCKIITQKYAIYKMAEAVMDHLSVRVPLPSQHEKEREEFVLSQRQASSRERSTSKPSSTVVSPTKAGRRLPPREGFGLHDAGKNDWEVLDISVGEVGGDSQLGKVPDRPHTAIVGSDNGRKGSTNSVRGYNKKDEQMALAYGGSLSPLRPQSQAQARQLRQEASPLATQRRTTSSSAVDSQTEGGGQKSRVNARKNVLPSSLYHRAATPTADMLQRRHDDLLVEWGKRQQVLAHDLYVERRVAKCIDDRREERIKRAVACQTPLQIRRVMEKVKARSNSDSQRAKADRRSHRHSKARRERYRPILASDSEEDEYFDDNDDGSESVCSHSSCSVCEEKLRHSGLGSKTGDPLVANEKGSRLQASITKLTVSSASVKALLAASANNGSPPRSPRQVATALVLEQQRQRERNRVERMLNNVNKKDERAAAAQDRKAGALELRRAKNALITAKADEVNARLERKVLFTKLLVANKCQQQDHKDSEKKAVAELRAKQVSADTKAKGALADLTRDVFAAAKVQVHKALYQQEKLNADYRALNSRGEYHHHSNSPTLEHNGALGGGAMRSGTTSTNSPQRNESPELKRRSNSILGSMSMLQWGGLARGAGRSQSREGKGFAIGGTSTLCDSVVVDSSPVLLEVPPKGESTSILSLPKTPNRHDRSLVVITEPTAGPSSSLQTGPSALQRQPSDQSPHTVEEAFNQAVESRKSNSRQALGKNLSKERALVKRWQQLEQQLHGNSHYQSM